MIAHWCQGTTYYSTHFEGQYNFSSGQDSGIWIKLIYSDFTSSRKDSFWVSGHFNRDYQRQYADNFNADALLIEIRNAKGKLLGSYHQGNGLYTFVCGGRQFPSPLQGKSCENYNTYAAGDLCLLLGFEFVRDSLNDIITTKNGHYSEPLGIYCEFSNTNQESPLYLEAPCYFKDYTHAPLKWFESENGKTNWKFVDTGRILYPAKSSYYGGRMFNQKRWYKVFTDTNITKGNLMDYASQILGPVTFYLGATMDSVVVKNSNSCSQKPDVWLYWNFDSVFAKRGYPRAWVYFTPKDSSTEQRWFLDTFSEWPLKINGRVLKKENGWPTPPQNLIFTAGKYKLMYDFTSWYGFNCKIQWDSFEIADSFRRGFDIKPKILANVSCYNDSNGVVSFQMATSDSAKLWVSQNRLNYFSSGHVFDHLAGGIQNFVVTDSQGCEVAIPIEFNNPPPFTVPLVPDTTLCNGQILHLNAHHINARQYLWLLGQDTLGRQDTHSVHNAGTYAVLWQDSAGCKASQNIRVKREMLDVSHDFLIPSQAFITDTVYAVNTSIPAADSYSWSFSHKGITSFSSKPFILGTSYPDTGLFQIHLKSKYKACGFSLTKTIHIIGNNDTAKSNPKLGYRGPLIQSFSIDPNPNDGYHYTIKVQLRDTFAISIYKIDPVSGDIIGDIDYKGKKYYESTAFSDAFATPGIYYLKVIAGTESKTIKVVIAK